jgi:hypothetical protein
MECGTVEWNGGTVEWNGGTVEWNGGMVESWNGATLCARMRIMKAPIASIANRATTAVLVSLTYYAFFCNPAWLWTTIITIEDNSNCLTVQ